jgi:1-acyl-sn-glycerol-3-phosphate acyltransferase
VIPHRKHRLFNAVFAAYVRRSLRRSFIAVRVEGLDIARASVARVPAVFVSNHTAWWDSLVLIWLANFELAEGGADGYALMDARNLRKFGFFRYLGVFGVDLDDPADRAAVVDYAAGLLDAPRRVVWLFPQGAERPVTEPLAFRGGAARLAARAGVPMVPAALRYEHGRAPKATVYVAFGEPIAPTGDEAVDTAACVAAVEALLARIEVEVRAAARGQGTFSAALGGSERRVGWAGRALAALAGR